MIETIESQRGYGCARPLNHIVVRPSLPLKFARDRNRHSVDITATSVELEGRFMDPPVTGDHNRSLLRIWKPATGHPKSGVRASNPRA